MHIEFLFRTRFYPFKQ